MKRLLIFGNSGSGKSTLARAYAGLPGVACLDLDTIAWKEAAIREEESVSIRKLDAFMDSNEQWIVEGCYSGLLGHASTRATELIFLNPGIEACIENCQSRPWESHKYESKEAQDQNLEMLVEWVKEYKVRTDEFSIYEHRRIFDAFAGKKRELNSNEEAWKAAADISC